jgi:hypothetical protein
MIIDEKWMHPPPPPYYPGPSPAPPPPFSEVAGSNENIRVSKPTLSTLPAHLLLLIVYSTFPQQDGRYEGESKIERQRMNLYWLETSLRLVNKALFTGKGGLLMYPLLNDIFPACMHILRSTYVPAYDSLIRPPYTSDPFSSFTPLPSASLCHVNREMSTLDLFIALLAHEDLLLDETELHLPREEAYKDLFDMIQPRSRLEDLVFQEGVKAGLISYQGDTSTSASELDDRGANITENAVSARPEVTGMDLPSAQLAIPSSVSPQPSPSPTKVSFNPFSRSSYISLAKSKMKRTSNSSSHIPSTPIDNQTPPASPFESTAFSSSSKLKAKITPLPFEALGVSFSPRRVALIYTPPASSSSNGAYSGSTYGALSVSVTGPTAAGGMKAKKTLVEISRARDEKLEVSAKRLIEGLEGVMSGGEL